MLTVLPTAHPEVLLLEPRLFRDARGFFVESFNAREFAAATGLGAQFVQDNHSRSSRGVLRGLHFQRLQPQGKLLRVARGEVFDVAVDLRRDSPRFGQWVGVTLSEENGRQLWIPPGFAHGFLVMSEVADFLYKTTDYYAPEHEACLRWDDPAVGVQWPLEVLAAEGVLPLLSAKDQAGKSLAELD